MVLLGFMFNYMLRVNLTIAIVTMVERNQTDEEVHVSECSGSRPPTSLNVSSNYTSSKVSLPSTPSPLSPLHFIL